MIYNWRIRLAVNKSDMKTVNPKDNEPTGFGELRGTTHVNYGNSNGSIDETVCNVYVGRACVVEFLPLCIVFQRRVEQSEHVHCTYIAKGIRRVPVTADEMMRVAFLFVPKRTP